MTPIDELFSRVAGGAPVPPEPDEQTRLLTHARNLTRSADEAQRLAAVRVVGRVGGWRAADVLRAYLADGSVAVRRAAVDGAVAIGADGLAPLRVAAGDADEGVALEVLKWLQRAVDTGSTPIARKLLASPSAAVRAAAVTLLGHAGGPGLVSALGALERDPDAAVRAAAAEAVERLRGKRERAKADPWWTQPDEAADWVPVIQALPEVLPTETRALVLLLGQVGDADRPRVIEALEGHGPAAVGMLAREVQAGGDAALSRGFAILCATWARSEWVATIRRLVSDRDPGVRVAAAQALGVVGKASVLLVIVELFRDPIPEVRLAAIDAFAAVAPPREVKRLDGFANDPDERVRAAAAAAGAKLRGVAPA